MKMSWTRLRPRPGLLVVLLAAFPPADSSAVRGLRGLSPQHRLDGDSLGSRRQLLAHRGQWGLTARGRRSALLASAKSASAGNYGHVLATDTFRRETSKGQAVPARRQGEYFRPVSTTVQCVLFLTIISLAIYTARTLSLNIDELSGRAEPSVPTQTLLVASRIAALPPTLCMLFLGCRMYVLATTQGLGEPPVLVKLCMYLASFGVAIQFLLAIVLPSVLLDPTASKGDATLQDENAEARGLGLANEPMEEPEPENSLGDTIAKRTGDNTDAHLLVHDIPFQAGKARAFRAAQGFSIFAVHCGAFGVVMGIIMYPKGATRISPAVINTVILCSLFLAHRLLLWAVRSQYSTEQDDYGNRALARAALNMGSALRKVPMLCILFLASRMRALQLNPPYGMPPLWMQICFFWITALVFLELLAAALVGAAGKLEKEHHGNYIFSSGPSFLHITKHVCCLGVCAFLLPVIIGVEAMTDANGDRAPLSTAVSCVLFLEGVYFGQVLAQEVFLLMANEKWQEVLLSASVSLSISPLLCATFVACRMRALQITNQQGAPQSWAQAAMEIAVFAVCVQAVCCVVLPLFTANAFKVDEDGNPDYDTQPMVAAYAVCVVKYVALILLHGSCAVVCIAVFTMTPQTAQVTNSDFTLYNKETIVGVIIISLVVVLIALILSSAKVAGLAVKFAVESADRLALGTDITMGHVALQACKGYVNIRDMKVHQPDVNRVYEKQEDGTMVCHEMEEKLQWHGDHMLTIKHVLVKINLWRVIRSLGREFELESLTFKGMHANVEKPTMNPARMDANVHHLMRHINFHFNLPEIQAQMLKLAKMAHVEKIAIHKIVVGDVSATVEVRGVPVVHSISFKPRLGNITFDDVTKEVFEGKESLQPKELVACIVKAIIHRMQDAALNDLPHRLLHGGHSSHEDASPSTPSSDLSSVKRSRGLLQQNACLSGCFAGPRAGARSSSRTPTSATRRSTTPPAFPGGNGSSRSLSRNARSPGSPPQAKS